MKTFLYSADIDLSPIFTRYVRMGYTHAPHNSGTSSKSDVSPETAVSLLAAQFLESVAKGHVIMVAGENKAAIEYSANNRGELDPCHHKGVTVFHVNEESSSVAVGIARDLGFGS